MGIYFNDKLLHPKRNGNEIEKRYFTEMEEINAMFEEKKTIVLVRDVDRVMDSKGTSYRAVVPFALPNEVPIYLDTLGAVSIRYSKEAPQRHGKEIVYPTYRNFMYERMILTENNKDLAWFILKATTFIQGGDPSSKKVIRISNPEKTVLNKASEVKRIAKVDALLMSEVSEVYDKDTLRIIADKFGVDIKDYDVEAAAFTIREAIIDADNSNNPDFNIQKFLNFVKRILQDEKREKKAQERIEAKLAAKERMVRYSQDELAAMGFSQMNPISKKLGTLMVPKVTKIVQIQQILAAQLKLDDEE